jgi:hypothetical protein
MYTALSFYTHLDIRLDLNGVMRLRFLFGEDVFE